MKDVFGRSNWGGGGAEVNFDQAEGADVKLRGGTIPRG